MSGRTPEREFTYEIVKPEQESAAGQKQDGKQTAAVKKQNTAAVMKTEARQAAIAAPKTADSANPLLWLIMAIGSLGFITSIMRFFRKIKQNTAD